MRPRDATGWTSIVSLILLMSGLQLLVLGVIGQYLARIFDEVHTPPLERNILDIGCAGGVNFDDLSRYGEV
jgi:hypothetical protein